MMIICMDRVDIWKKNGVKRGGGLLEATNTDFIITVKLKYIGSSSM